jgi:hypothetical protein
MKGVNDVRGKSPGALQSKSGTASHPSSEHIENDHALHAELALSREYFIVQKNISMESRCGLLGYGTMQSDNLIPAVHRNTQPPAIFSSA